MTNTDNIESAPTLEEMLECEIDFINELVKTGIYLGSFKYQIDSKEFEFIIYTEKTSVIPDIFVFTFDDIISQYELYNDINFINKVISTLRVSGFKGRSFERAELGLHGNLWVVMEPSEDFNKWVTKLGWIDEYNTDLN